MVCLNTYVGRNVQNHSVIGISLHGWDLSGGHISMVILTRRKVASENGASSFKKEALLLVARFGKKIHGETNMWDCWWLRSGKPVHSRYFVSISKDMLHIPCGDLRIDTSPKTVRHGKVSRGHHSCYLVGGRTVDPTYTHLLLDGKHLQGTTQLDS